MKVEKDKIRNRREGRVHRHFNLKKELISLLMVAGGDVGAPSTHVHPTIMQYITKEVNGTSVIDLSVVTRNIMSLYKLISVLINRNRLIMIVANTPDHARIASSLLGGLTRKVMLLTTRWNPGMFSNYHMFSVIVGVHRRTSKKNKTASIIRYYNTKYKPIEELYTTRNLPRLVIFIDVVGIETAMAETAALGIPMVGFVDTDYNNDGSLTYVIPIGRSVRAMSLIMIVLRIMIKKASINVKHKGVDHSIDAMNQNSLSGRTWHGKRKWINRNKLQLKSNIVAKYVMWKKLRIADLESDEVDTDVEKSSSIISKDKGSDTEEKLL